MLDVITPPANARAPRSRPAFAGALLTGAILVAVVLRFATLDSVPPGLNQDEAVNGYDAYSLSLTGRDHHGHPFPFAGLESFGDWASPLLTFMTVPAVAAFGLRTEVVRGVAAAIGVAAVPAIYWLAVELFERRTLGVLAAWLLALSPWHIHRSRFANPAAIVPTMVILLMLAIVWAMRRRSSRGIVGIAIASVLAISSYPTMKLYVPLLLVGAAAIYRKSLRHFDPEALGYAAGIFLLFAGPIFFLSLADPGGRARFDQLSVLSRPDAGRSVVRQYVSFFSPRVFFTTGNGHPGQTATPPGTGVEPQATVPFLLAGLLWLIRRIRWSADPWQRQSAMLLLAALLLYPIPGSLTIQNTPHLGRGVQVIPLLVLIAAAGAVAIIDYVSRLRVTARRAEKIAVAAVSIFLALGFSWELASRYRDYFGQYPQRPRVTEYFQDGLGQAVSYAHTHEAAYDQVWVSNENQSYIYVLFFEKWPPSDVHRSLLVARHPPDFNEVGGIGKYRFGDPPEVRRESLVLLQMIRDAGGRPAYQVREGLTMDEQRILVISKAA